MERSICRSNFPARRKNPLRLRRKFPAARLQPWRKSAENRAFPRILRVGDEKYPARREFLAAFYQLGERLVIAWARWVYSSQPVPQSVLITPSCALACVISPLMT